jgi:hypothetical protein
VLNFTLAAIDKVAANYEKAAMGNITSKDKRSSNDKRVAKYIVAARYRGAKRIR